MYGTVHLDDQGYVKNLAELQKKTVEDLEQGLLQLPNFVSADVFSGAIETLNPLPEVKPNQTTQPTRPEPGTPITQEQTPVGPSNADYYAVIKECEKSGKVNSEGYADMGTLIEMLREKGMPVISGTRRLELTDEGRKMEAFTAPTTPPQ
jgi:hypothetical protein